MKLRFQGLLGDIRSFNTVSLAVFFSIKLIIFNQLAINSTQWPNRKNTFPYNGEKILIQ